MKLIEIRMTKATLFLTEQELTHLLCLNPELWTAAIKRGKRIKREQAAERKSVKTPKFNSFGMHA